ncbi:MAG: hypothetical protein WC824_01060 [Bacteroidota bacterium]|jgi:P pilus assembly chaperone PapD
MRISRSLAVLAFFMLMTASLQADIRVSPTVIYLSSNNNSSVVTVTSVAKYPINVRMELYYGFPHSDSLGNVSIYLDETGAVHAESCVPYIRLHPNRFMLLPGQSRAIRFIINLPAGMPDREYWSRLVITSEKRQNDIDAGEEEEKISASQSFAIRTIIPIIYRKGDVAADVKLLNMSALRLKDQVQLFVDMQPLGNAAYVGNLLLDILDGKGRVYYSSRQELAVYDMHRRRFDIPGASLPPGRYKARIRFNTDREDMGKLALPVLPKEYTVEFIMP